MKIKTEYWIDIFGSDEVSVDEILAIKNYPEPSYIPTPEIILLFSVSDFIGLPIKEGKESNFVTLLKKIERYYNDGIYIDDILNWRYFSKSFQNDEYHFNYLGNYQYKYSKTAYGNYILTEPYKQELIINLTNDKFYNISLEYIKKLKDSYLEEIHDTSLNGDVVAYFNNNEMDYKVELNIIPFRIFEDSIKLLSSPMDLIRLPINLGKKSFNIYNGLNYPLTCIFDADEIFPDPRNLYTDNHIHNIGGYNSFNGLKLFEINDCETYIIDLHGRKAKEFKFHRFFKL